MPPLVVSVNANGVPTNPDLEKLVQNAYDTGYYAAEGKSGTNIHTIAMKERNETWQKIAFHLAAAEALAEAAQAAQEWHAAYPYNNQEFELATSAEVHARLTIALRQWEETK